MAAWRPGPALPGIPGSQSSDASKLDDPGWRLGAMSWVRDTVESAPGPRTQCPDSIIILSGYRSASLLPLITFLFAAAILANLLLGSESADEAADSYGAPAETYGAPVETYGAPAQDSYGAPAPSYEEPAPAYEAPSYSAPADTYGSPAAPAVADEYGSPAADPLPAYNGRY